jgi:hypothetical protein
LVDVTMRSGDRCRRCFVGVLLSIFGAIARRAAIEHARGEWVGLPFIWMACGAQKLAAFFHVGRI